MGNHKAFKDGVQDMANGRKSPPAHRSPQLFVFDISEVII